MYCLITCARAYFFSMLLFPLTSTAPLSLLSLLFFNLQPISTALQLHQSYLTLLHRDVATAASEAAQVAQPANEDGSSTTPKGGAGPQYDAQGKGGGSGKGGGWLSSLLGSSGSGSAKDENAEPPLLYAVDKMHSNTW